MCCDCKGPQSDFSLLKGVLDEYASQPGSLITILQQAQDIYGYLPKDVMYHIAERVGVTPAEVVWPFSMPKYWVIAAEMRSEPLTWQAVPWQDMIRYLPMGAKRNWE